jgi:hypothetical protein
MTPEEKSVLIEQVVSAYRARDPQGEIRSSPAFFDLDVEGRNEAFEATLASRAMEAALDPDGLSTTARALLARIKVAT